MKQTVETHYLYVRDLDDLGSLKTLDNADMLRVSPLERKLILSNPNNREDSVFMIAGVCNNHVIGGCKVWPVRLVADSELYDVAAAGSLWVEKEYRKTGYGAEICDYIQDHSPAHLNVGYGMSQKARRLVTLRGDAVFDVARFACIRKSHFFLANYLAKYDKPLVRFVVDIGCAIHRVFVRTVCWLHIPSLVLTRVDSTDVVALKDYAKLIEADGHRFREQMTADQIKWILENDFTDLELADKSLYKITKGGDRVGYAITRYSKEGRLGCVIDWQIDYKYAKLEPWILVRLMLQLLPRAEASVLAVPKTEMTTGNVLKRILIPCPNQLANVSPSNRSPLMKHEGWRDAANWRIRPSMGDGAFY